MKLEKVTAVGDGGMVRLNIPTASEYEEMAPGSVHLHGHRLGTVLKNGFIYPVGPHPHFIFRQDLAGPGSVVVPEGITNIAFNLSGGAGGIGRPYRSNPDRIENRRRGGDGGRGYAHVDCNIPIEEQEGRIEPSGGMYRVTNRANNGEGGRISGSNSGAGAGFLLNGQSGGFAFVNGGLGLNTINSNLAQGGFGGGGVRRGSFGGAGGGGFSGGSAAGGNSSTMGGGGGGSLNNGNNQYNVPGINEGDGYVLIELLRPVIAEL